MKLISIILLIVLPILCCVWLARIVIKSLKTGVANTKDKSISRLEHPKLFVYTIIVQCFFIAAMAAVSVIYLLKLKN